MFWHQSVDDEATNFFFFFFDKYYVIKKIPVKIVLSKKLV